jgi:hypothetical protein
MTDAPANGVNVRLDVYGLLGVNLGERVVRATVDDDSDEDLLGYVDLGLATMEKLLADAQARVREQREELGRTVESRDG